MLGRFSLFRSTQGDHPDPVEAESSVKCCPDCGDEYRSEFTRCAACNVDLISVEQPGKDEQSAELQKSSRDLNISPHDSLVPIRRGSLQDIKTLQRVLRSEYIGSMLIEDESEGNKGCCGGKVFDLLVKQEDARDALKVLVEDYRRTTDLANHDFGNGGEVVIDLESNQASCPACGCQFRPEDKSCPECGLCF